jgi:hypothetical protein
MDFMLTTIEFCYYEEDVMDVLMSTLQSTQTSPIYTTIATA